jgi:hypothetical protein
MTAPHPRCYHFKEAAMSRSNTLLATVMIIATGALLMGQAKEPAEAPKTKDDPCFRCTLVIGYSQVGQWSQQGGGWYVTGGEFEKAVGADRWQLLWAGGAGVDRWQNPDYPGWRQPIRHAVPDIADKPDRVLLSISGPYGEDEAAWARAISATIDTIKTKYPSARQIILQPVVGGPGGQTCAPPGRPDGRVRASWQHKHIHAAIRQVVKDRGEDSVRIVEGFAPQVRTCDDYSDALGHLKQEAAAVIGKAIGEHYAQRDTECAAAGHPHCR